MLLLLLDKELPKFSDIKSFIIPMDSVGQEFWQGTVDMACSVPKCLGFSWDDLTDKVTNRACSATITLQHWILIFLCKIALFFFLITLTVSVYLEFKGGTTPEKIQMAKE